MSKNNSNSVMDMVGDALLLMGKVFLWLIVALLNLTIYLLRASEELLRSILK